MSISLILLLVVTLVRLAIFAFVIYAAVQGVKALRNNIIVNPHLPPVGDEDGERSHVETITRDRVIEGHERIKDVQLMP